MFSISEFTEDAVVQFGIDPLTAYELTPYEITVAGRQATEKQTREFENILALAWHTEAFARQKKLPRLSKILKDVRRKPNNKMSAGDALLKALAAEKGVKIP